MHVSHLTYEHMI